MKCKLCQFSHDTLSIFGFSTEQFLTIFFILQEARFASLSKASLGYTLFYSTVTDFARLRGWSTSLPKNSAI